jgi:ABC-type multidrug transport system fused ATPase/permease subunit
VIFEHVSFGYDGGQKILDGLDCAVKTGETVALVGPSGCGKSTLLRLLCGFYEPQSGSIRIYGNDLFHSDLSAARQYVSLVSQDTYLFPTTITENIAYGRLGASQGEIIAAARAANAHDFITAFKKQYDTPVGEWGAKLSGGERQRIALARAILKDAPILLLDEPTSALDTQSEAVVQEALDRLMQGRTVLIIAHRLSTIQGADRIFVLNEGKIQESGTHAGLMRAGGLYRQLYLKQMTSNVEREV